MHAVTRLENKLLNTSIK